MAELMSSGIELMFAGMGIVFLFLTMLVFAINMMSALVQRFFPEAPPTSVIAPTASSNAPDKATVAAIAAAVHQYRKQK
ncbi:MAG: OadG family transporter subunit [Methylovulum sp.]|uniref:OadG family protein n=1 Tax=Methylovulum sp. TaxID=1916980 RepID=UPI002637672F|nr:OadG family transporter subunit [Methylovulum sp.]MDD2724231.1 OadG family transporter subunit [Methylovulum sp.]